MRSCSARTRKGVTRQRFPSRTVPHIRLHCQHGKVGGCALGEQSMRAYAEWGRETEMKVQDSSELARPDEQLSFLQLQVCPGCSSKLPHLFKPVICMVFGLAPSDEQVFGLMPSNEQLSFLHCRREPCGFSVRAWTVLRAG